MNPVIVTALIGAAGVIIGALASFWIQSRRLPSDIRLVEAQTEELQHKTAAGLIQDLNDEVNRLKAKVIEFETRLTKAEARATEAEERLADAEVRAHEFRRAVIAIGERLDKERAKSRQMVVKLVGLVRILLDCIENPTKAIEVDRATIAGQIQAMLDEYPPEQFVRV